MQQWIKTLDDVATVGLWGGLGVQFWLRRGQQHREVLFATAGVAVAITLFLPPIAALAARLVGSSGPCNLFQNVWGVFSSGLILLAVAAGHGRRAVLATVASTVTVMAVIGVLAEWTSPSPAGCVTSEAVPATSPFWWLLIGWHIAARAAALAACLRDAARLHDDVWARRGVWWYTAGFAASALYWAMLGVVLVTDRHWTTLSSLTTYVLAATTMAVTVAVWWAVGQRAMHYLYAVVEFARLYGGLAGQGWTAQERRALWTDSLREWYRSPEVAAYRVRIAAADYRIDRIDTPWKGQIS